jgi:hypothetical protein
MNLSDDEEISASAVDNYPSNIGELSSDLPRHPCRKDWRRSTQETRLLWYWKTAVSIAECGSGGSDLSIG